jgi:hypothetical protein
LHRPRRRGKAAADERQSRVNWKRIEQADALFVADEKA